MEISVWHDFFGAQVVGSAALLGLLFVAISLNLATVLSEGSLADRAAISLTLMFGNILSSSLVLLPGQSAFDLGIELLAVGLLVSLIGAGFERRVLRGAAVRGFAPAVNLLLLAAAALPQLVGGALLVSGATAGLYWIAAAILASLTKAVLDAWVLLVEINR